MYRGVPMMEGWPEKIAAAQKIDSYTLDGSITLAFDSEVNTTIGMQIESPAMTAGL